MDLFAQMASAAIIRGVISQPISVATIREVKGLSHCLSKWTTTETNQKFESVTLRLRDSLTLYWTIIIDADLHGKNNLYRAMGRTAKKYFLTDFKPEPAAA